MVATDNLTHIFRDERGVAWIDDTNTKVIEVVLDHLAYGWSVDAMHEQHPHLSLAQLHATMGFYYDHAAEFNGEIERQEKEVDALLAQRGFSPVQMRFRAMRAEKAQALAQAP